MSTNPLAVYSLGLPMWSKRSWLGSLFPAGANSKTFLNYYSGVFNTVEGNTSFYALPDKTLVQSWADQVQPGFRFCFKLPKRITHDNALRHSDAALREFFQRLALLSGNLGSFMIQLPASFAPENLVDLEKFLGKLPKDFTYSVEVRHEGFFRRDDHEKNLNRLLQAHNIDRVCFDSRALFSLPATSPEEIDAHKKKPRLPVHAIATATQPIVRFIGSSNREHNRQYLLPWVKKLGQWLSDGLRPTIFIHTPDNQQAPRQAIDFHNLLEHLPGWQPLPKLASSSQASFFE